MVETILIVDDEPGLLDLIRTSIEDEGMMTIEAQDGYGAITKVREELPDLVILDVMMPGMDGFETLKEIRSVSNIPVIMLTGEASERAKVRGLELGADDYVAKPFSHRELLGRVKAVLRRTRMSAPLATSKIEVDADLSIDFDKREVTAHGERLKLRPTEYKLLYHLVTNSGRLITHEALLSKVWGREYRDDTQLLRLYITYLRQKIEKQPSQPKYILNERGIGYRFAEY